MASCAARLISAGAEKSGKPCARLTASYCMACRVISRITDSVKCSTLSERKYLGWRETCVMKSSVAQENCVKSQIWFVILSEAKDLCIFAAARIHEAHIVVRVGHSNKLLNQTTSRK